MQRYSHQRERIYETVCGTKEHPTAQMVYDALRAELPKLSLGTVYRNLNRLAELGTIRRISVTNSPDRFDGDLTPHHHICCTACGKFCDFFDIDYDKELDKVIEAKSGFSLVKHETVFYGRCDECKLIDLN